MHIAKRKRVIKGTGGHDKVAVMGLLERPRGAPHSLVRTMVLDVVTRGRMQGEIKKNVATGSAVYTDRHWGYHGLGKDYMHDVVDHASEYVRGRVHTNGIENFWSLVKRALHGTYVSIEPFHVFRYLDEQAFRFNHRGDNDPGRFVKALRGIIIERRLTYSEAYRAGNVRFMSEKKRPTHTSGADPGPERIKYPQAGLDRLKDALRHLFEGSEVSHIGRRREETGIEVATTTNPGTGEYLFKIEAFTPETMPMARLAKYLTELAAILGESKSVHLIRIESGSTALVHKIEHRGHSEGPHPNRGYSTRGRHLAMLKLPTEKSTYFCERTTRRPYCVRGSWVPKYWSFQAPRRQRKYSPQ